MVPKVRETLLEIANDFIEFLDVDILVSDVVMTGSLANFNWSNYSDVDIHIIVDFNQFSEKTKPLYEELFRLKKTIYTTKQDIKIFGYDVELYVEDENIDKDVKNIAIYSVMYDEWISEPKKDSIKFNQNSVTEKAKQWMKIIDGVYENIQDEDIETAKKLIQKYVEKIRKYRQCGLESDGEYSEENLVFKILRRNGYLEKIRDMKNKLVDKRLSLKEATTTIGGKFKVDLENGPLNHGKRAFGNWQSDNAWDIFAPAGTIVNSYTEGVVTKVRDTGKNSGKVFGTQVSIKGENDYPDIFYTHLKNVKLTKGQTVKVGDVIGQISEWVGHDNMTHVHIGLPRGKHLRDLLKNSGKIFVGSSGSSGENETVPAPDSTPLKRDEVLDKEIVDNTNELISKNSEFTGVKKEDVITTLKNAEEGNNKILSDFYKLVQSKKELKNLKGIESRLPVDKDVELLQTALQFLGFLLPKWGIDGKFGPETEQAVKDFQKKYGLQEDGSMNTEDLTKLFSILTLKNFNDSNMSKIKKDEDLTSSDITAKTGGPQQTGDVKLISSFKPEQEKNIAYLVKEMDKIGITNPYTQIGVLSVISKESNFIPKSETSYSTTSPERIRGLFGSRVAHLSDSQINQLKQDDRKFYNLIYAKTVGNQGGDDGYRYRGRGFNQLTGIKNYQKYSNMIGMGNKLVDNPDLVNNPEIAAKIALAFFTKGKSPSTFPNFNNKKEAAIYFADINAGGGVSSHRGKAIKASEKFDVSV
jgi:predicted chitinase/predicted nucleotidyltransferase